VRVPESWRSLLDAVPAAVLIVAPDGTICFINTAMEQMTGYGRAELSGQPVERLVPEGQRATHAASRTLYGAGPARRPMGTGLDIGCRRADGSVIPVDISLAPLEVAGEAFVIATVADETEHRRSSEELFHRAVHDPLTGLANRVLLIDRLQQALARADRQARWLGVLYIDLDGFKAVNDAWHHTVGDEVLRIVARRLAAVVRPLRGRRIRRPLRGTGRRRGCAPVGGAHPRRRVPPDPALSWDLPARSEHRGCSGQRPGNGGASHRAGRPGDVPGEAPRRIRRGAGARS
jgi:PAS domain S-box-containing protein